MVHVARGTGSCTLFTGNWLQYERPDSVHHALLRRALRLRSRLQRECRAWRHVVTESKRNRSRVLRNRGHWGTVVEYVY